MKLGFSSYSFNQKLASAEMTIFDVIDWVSDVGAEHLEIAVLDERSQTVPTIRSDAAFVEEVRAHAASRSITLSNMSIGADLLVDDAAIEGEVARVVSYVELAARLGIRRLRHDVAMRDIPGDDTSAFDAALPRIATNSRLIADRAAEYGITTSLENHGYFVQNSDRIRRVIRAVDRANFRTTLDVGNFLCVDEDPLSAVQSNLQYASIVHLKDFYVRQPDDCLGDGWFRSRAGRYLRGSIVGEGDMDLIAIMRFLKKSNYSGFASIEFEGIEDCLLACERALANARRLYAAA